MTAQSESSALPDNRRPSYHSTTRVNGRTVGEFMAPIPDPLARTTVMVGWRDVLRSLLTRRSLVVEVCIGADSRTATRLLELDPDYLGPAGSPSRKAWDAALNERLGSL